MKHVLYLLIFLFQSCGAMNSHQTPEEAFRQELRRYLRLPNIEILTDLSKEEKQQYNDILKLGSIETISGTFSLFQLLFGIQATPPQSVREIQSKVENIAKDNNIFNPLKAIVRCVNGFAKTNQESPTEIFHEELNRILALSWADLTKLPNNKVQGSSVDMMRAGLEQAKKDRTKGKQLNLTIHKKTLLCHLLLAYGGAPNATLMIYTALQHYTIVD